MILIATLGVLRVSREVPGNPSNSWLNLFTHADPVVDYGQWTGGLFFQGPSDLTRFSGLLCRYAEATQVVQLSCRGQYHYHFWGMLKD